jgi:hypothetical protein
MEAERIDRLIAILSEAAGLEYDGEAFGGDEPLRQRTIDLLESLGFIEARDGVPADGEDPDREYVVGITSLGRAELEDLRARRAEIEPERPRRTRRGCISTVLSILGI